MPKITMQGGYLPGSIGRISTLHAIYYTRHWRFGLKFEAKVARELSDFFLRYKKERDGFWNVIMDGTIGGSIAIDGINAESKGAHLRWFILSDSLRAKGVGRRLFRKATDFCQHRGYNKIYLWTFEGLDAARYLYEEAGFQLVSQQSGEQWGTKVNEQCFELVKG